jgi:ABC-type multidrug transport system ATPase subunit
VGPLGRARLWDTIRQSAEDGVGVLVTTHHIEEAEQCDHLVMMAAGRQVAAGTVDEVVGAHSAVEIATGEWKQAFRSLEEAGWPVRLSGRNLRVAGVGVDRVEQTLSAAGVMARVQVRPATLDETFVALTRS